MNALTLVTFFSMILFTSPALCMKAPSTEAGAGEADAVAPAGTGASTGAKTGGSGKKSHCNFTIRGCLYSIPLVALVSFATWYALNVSPEMPKTTSPEVPAGPVNLQETLKILRAKVADGSATHEDTTTLISLNNLLAHEYQSKYDSDEKEEEDGYSQENAKESADLSPEELEKDFAAKLTFAVNRSNAYNQTTRATQTEENDCEA